MQMSRSGCILVPLLLIAVSSVTGEVKDPRYRDMDMILQVSGVDPFKTLHPRFDGVEDLDVLMPTYYVNPRPELISRAMRSLPESSFLKQPDNTGGAVAFFSEVFADNPNLVAKWRREIAKLREPTRTVLHHAMDISGKGGVLKLDGHSTTLNDMRWAAFYASGNKAYVRQLIAEFRHFDERKDANLFFTGATAMWSAAWHAKLHPVVKAALEETEATTDDERLRELVVKVLALGTPEGNPDAIRDEMRATYEKQHEAGVW